MTLLFALSEIGLALGIAGLHLTIVRAAEIRKHLEDEIAFDATGPNPASALKGITLDGQSIDIRLVAAASETLDWLDECEYAGQLDDDFSLETRADVTTGREQLAVRRRYGRVAFLTA